MKHIMHAMRITDPDDPTGAIIENMVVHYEGCFSDYALCGQDIDGDNIYGVSWNRAVYTNKRVNCEDCLAVRDHVLGRNN